MIGLLNNAALVGMQNGFDSLQKNASQIASVSTIDGTNTKSLVEAVVDLKANVQQLSASMKVFKVSDEIIGTLLDIEA